MTTFEQVPQYSLVQLDDGIEEKLQLLIKIPGVTSVSEFNVLIEPSSFHLHAPGRYLLDLSLDVTIDQVAKELKFVKKRSEVRAVLGVIGGRPLQSNVVTKDKAAGPEPAPPAPSNLHDSFLADAAKLMNKPRRVRSAPRAKPGKPGGLRGQDQARVEEQQVENEDEDLPECYTPPIDTSLQSELEEPTDESHHPAANGQPQGSNTVQHLASSDSGKGPGCTPLIATASTASAEEAFSAPGEGDRRGGLNGLHGPSLQQAAGRDDLLETSDESTFAFQGTDNDRCTPLYQQDRPTPQDDAHSSVSHAEQGPRLDQAAGAKKLGVESQRAPAKTSSKKSSKKGSPPVESPSPVSSKPTTPRSDERQRKWSKGSAAKQQRQQQASPKCRSEIPDDSSQSACDVGDKDEILEASKDPMFGSSEWWHGWKDERRHYGAVRFAVAASCMLVALLAFDLLRLAILTSVRVFKASPHILPAAMVKMRWTRLHRSTTKVLQSSREARWASAGLSLLLGFTVCWYGVKIAWGLLGLSWSLLCFTVVALARSSMWLFLCLIWQPSALTSMGFSIFLRYSERLFGETHWTIIAVGVWGWPVMSWSVGSGFLGLLTVPYALAASVIVLSHVNVIVCFLVSWLPACLRAAWWPPGLTIRVLSFAWTAGYLYCKAYLPPLSRKKAVEEVREVPQGTEGEVARVLQAVDHYDVLQVPVSAATDALRRAKRIKALATHPDKLGQTPAANEAFARVTEAFDVLSDDKKRRQYDAELQHKALLERLQAEAGGLEGSREDDSQIPAGVSFFCSSCGCSHHGRFTKRKPDRARWCGECKEYHPAKSGDGWHESTFGVFGSKIKMFVCVDNTVIDMTEWAECMLKSSAPAQMPVNTHTPQYNFGGGPESQHSAPNKKKKGKAKHRR